MTNDDNLSSPAWWMFFLPLIIVDSVHISWALCHPIVSRHSTCAYSLKMKCHSQHVKAYLLKKKTKKKPPKTWQCSAVCPRALWCREAFAHYHRAGCPSRWICPAECLQCSQLIRCWRGMDNMAGIELNLDSRSVLEGKKERDGDRTKDVWF